jgi:pre-rRNA-processing protein TSR1
LIRSKEKLIFSTGVRTFSAGAIFSQHALGEKHKFERYFQPGSTVIASVFAPIMFPPAPVLVFQEISPGVLNLVASGTVHSVNPDRMIIKRIRISGTFSFDTLMSDLICFIGYPVKINKGSAVIRYMFFNPEDILWFKPVELVTKLGRRGHIKESLGTHGHMKCIFDKPIKQHDVVLMNLYKRVYPKWTYEEKPLDTMRVETLHMQDAPPSMSVDE